MRLSISSVSAGITRGASGPSGRLRTPPARRRARLEAIERLEERVCLTSATVTVTDSSPVTIPITGLHGGDVVTVTATLTTTDANENGEGEPLVVQGSGGESVTVPNYNAPQSATFKIGQDGETLSAFIPGADGDETGSVTVNVNQHKALSQSTRDFLSKLGQALVIGGVAAELIAENFGPAITALCPPCEAALAAGGGVTLLGGLIIEYIASDPDDPNFTAVAQPSIPSMTPVTAGSGLTQAEADAFNALDTNQEQIIGLGQALLTSLNRESGAFDAGDSAHEALQLQAVRQYSGQIANLLNEQVALRNQLVGVLQAAGFPTFTASSSDALTFEQGVASDGLPASVVTALQQLGADNPTIDTIKGLAIVQDTNAVAGSFPAELADPNLLSALSSTSQSLQAFAGPAGGISLQFGAPTYSASDGGGTATITVTRTGSIGPVSVDYATSDGTATAGTDYTSTHGTLAFADGETTKTFTIPILGDPRPDGSETLNLTLSNPSLGASLGAQSTAALTINDATSAPADLAIVPINAPTTATLGSSTTYTFMVTNNGPGDATSVVVSDPLPAGFTLVSLEPAGDITGRYVDHPAGHADRGSIGLGRDHRHPHDDRGPDEHGHRLGGGDRPQSVQQRREHDGDTDGHGAAGRRRPEGPPPEAVRLPQPADHAGADLRPPPRPRLRPGRQQLRDQRPGEGHHPGGVGGL